MMCAYTEMLNRPVRSLALRELVTAKFDTPIRMVIEKLQSKGLGCAVIVDETGRPLGLFTEKGVTRGIQHNPDFFDQSSGQHLDPVWERVSLTDPISAVLDAVTHRGLRFLCVVDSEGQAVGLAGQKGLLEYFAEYAPRHVQTTTERIGSEGLHSVREGA